MSEPQRPLELGYESAAPEPQGRRPKWVWAVVVIYLLIFSIVLLLPLWVKLSEPSDNDPLIAATITSCALVLCGLGLVFTRVRIARRRPLTRASLWIPLLASGLLVGTLFAGVGYAVVELVHGERFAFDWLTAISIGGGVVWLAWAGLIWWMTSQSDPTSVAMRLHRWLIVGSVAELLVAVPCHIVVRRREECCAGFLTGTAICIGCVVMFLALGPGVVFLYYKRWKQISRSASPLPPGEG